VYYIRVAKYIKRGEKLLYNHRTYCRVWNVHIAFSTQLTRNKGKFKPQNAAADSRCSVTVTLLFERSVRFWCIGLFCVCLLQCVTVRLIVGFLNSWTCLLFCRESKCSSVMKVTKVTVQLHYVIWKWFRCIFCSLLCCTLLTALYFDLVWNWHWCSLSLYSDHYNRVTDHFSAYTGADVLYQPPVKS
jgi:hypothetical protein